MLSLVFILILEKNLQTSTLQTFDKTDPFHVIEPALALRGFYTNKNTHARSCTRGERVRDVPEIRLALCALLSLCLEYRSISLACYLLSFSFSFFFLDRDFSEGRAIELCQVARLRFLGSCFQIFNCGLDG